MKQPNKTDIFAENKRYSRWLPVVNLIFRGSFRRLTYSGLEHIPGDGAIIFAPNHSNALLDALAILALDNAPKVFAARADIFRKPRTAAILRWLRILPIRRIRDGIDEVRHNDDTLDEAVETLRHRVPFVIMPEGTHRPSYELMPLKKGIFRIALQANSDFGQDMPVYIVPVNLHYADFTHLWTSLDVRFGEPICITQYTAEHANLPQPVLINQLLDLLTARMKALVPQESTEGTSTKGILRLLWLTILTLLFPICWLLTLPQQLAKPIIRHKVKDPCFRNSVLYMVWLITILLSCGLCYLPLIEVEETLHQYRQLHTIL